MLLPVGGWTSVSGGSTKRSHCRHSKALDCVVPTVQGKNGRKVYFGTSATRLTLAARLVRRTATRLWRAATRGLSGEPLRGYGGPLRTARGGPLRGSWRLAGRYAALAAGPLRGTTSWPRRGLGAAACGAATRHKYTIPVQSFFMKPSSRASSCIERGC